MSSLEYILRRTCPLIHIRLRGRLGSRSQPDSSRSSFDEFAPSIFFFSKAPAASAQLVLCSPPTTNSRSLDKYDYRRDADQVTVSSRSVLLVAWYYLRLARSSPHELPNLVEKAHLGGGPDQQQRQPLSDVYITCNALFRGFEQGLLLPGPEAYRKIIATARLLVRTLGTFAQVRDRWRGW